MVYVQPNLSKNRETILRIVGSSSAKSTCFRKGADGAATDDEEGDADTPPSFFSSTRFDKRSGELSVCRGKGVPIFGDEGALKTGVGGDEEGGEVAETFGGLTVEEPIE